MFYDLGKILDGKRAFELLEEQLSTGLAVLGTTGGGKSRFLWQLLREHRRNRRGFVLIDPGDLADDFLADCAQEIVTTGDDRILKKIHLLQLSPLQMARYDPLRPPDLGRVHPEVRDVCYRAWQHTKVQSVAEVFQRKQGQTDFEGMARLQRVITNVFTAVSTLVGGKRLSVGDALILIDVGHPDHGRVFRRLARRLPREILADFETLHSFKRPQDVRTETESTLNRLRSMLGPLMRQMLSGTGAEPTLSVQKIVERGDYLIVSVKKTPFTSYDQNVGLAGMVIHDWVEALLNCDREKRRGSTLIIDEAHEFMAPDLPRAQRIIRKYGGGLVLCTQDLVSLRKKDLDLAPAVLGLANTIACFRLTWPDDVETMARILFSKNLDFTPLEHDVYQHRGEYDWITIYEKSVQLNQQRQWSHGDTVGRTLSETDQESEQESEQENWSDATSEQHGTANADTEGWADQHSSAQGQHDSPVLVDGELKRTLQVGTRQDSASHTRNGGRTRTATTTEGKTRTKGGSKTKGKGKSHATQAGQQQSHSDTEAVALGQGLSVAEKHMPMPRIVHDKQKTGALERSLPDQLAQFGQEIATLPRQQAVVRVREGEAVRIEVAEVRDPFASPTAQMKAVDWMKRRLYEAHDYYFTPSADPEDEERRIADFVDEADEPVVVEQAGDEDRTETAEESPML
jgi:hypothetical protein